MAWSEARATERIRRLVDSAPDIKVSDLETFLTARRTLKEVSAALGTPSEEPIFSVPRNQAVTTHAVHIYANLVDFNTHLTENDRETEASHRRALQFLHTHYAACDQLIASFGIQRVDFHGSRLHAVVLSPSGPTNEKRRVEIAIEFAAAFREMVARIADRFGDTFSTRVKVGIDTGPAVAISSGKHDELEPLFVGRPANHAAKAAAGEGEGIVLTQEAQRALGRPTNVVHASMYVDSADEFRALSAQSGVDQRSLTASARLEEAFTAFAQQRSISETFDAQRAAFAFHHHQPPLRSIVYSDHPPSNAIRMAMVSIFADIDGFTAYIDTAIATGTIAQAVANLHVMRGEMNFVLRDDFGGRKVRFVGDCIHGVIAEGTAREVDLAASVRAAVMTAAGIRSSIDLCKVMLPGIASLGIAIGIELGTTPITRLGLRGDASVRCATSRSTCVSEEVQCDLKGHQTGIGPAAYDAADPYVKRLFGEDRCVPNLTNRNATALLTGVAAVPAAAVAVPAAAAAAPSIIIPREPMRAHYRK